MMLLKTFVITLIGCILAASMASAAPLEELDFVIKHGLEGPKPDPSDPCAPESLDYYARMYVKWREMGNKLDYRSQFEFERHLEGLELMKKCPEELEAAFSRLGV